MPLAAAKASPDALEREPTATTSAVSMPLAPRSSFRLMRDVPSRPQRIASFVLTVSPVHMWLIRSKSNGTRPYRCHTMRGSTNRYRPRQGETMTEERPAPDTEEQADPQQAADQPGPDARPEPAPMVDPALAPRAGDADDLGDDIVAEAATPRHAQGGRPQARRVLAAVFWLLASISVLFGSVAVWTHQTLLTGDGWGGIVEDVISQEAVTEAISVTIVERALQGYRRGRPGGTGPARPGPHR